MSILSFLFFASIIYFAAADPIAETAPKAPSDQDKVNSFMSAVFSAYDEYIATHSLITSMSKDNSDYIRTTAMDGVGRFINLCMMAAQKLSESGTFSQADDNDFTLKSLKEGLPSVGSPSFPAVPYQETPVPAPKEALVADN